MEKIKIKTFLAANSCDGFISYFGNSYYAKKGWKAYIIKGGPGTGKSSFMKYLVVKASEKGIDAELCPCSSDPDSLDAVIFPKIKTIIMDGTAPHTVDPIYPGVCDTILNFGEFWKKEKLTDNVKEIIELTDKNKQFHKTASLYLNAAGSFLRDNYKTSHMLINENKLEAFAKKLCEKYFKSQDKPGKEEIRFLSGVTPKGIVFFADTIKAICKETVIIEDQYGSASNALMRKIKNNALKNGYNVISVKNSFLPDLYDHILIPELSLGFVRESEFSHIKSDERRIHSRRFLDIEALNKSRERIRFNKKATRELLLTAATTISQAKSVHDELEKYYINAMDFEKLTAFAEGFSKEIFV